MSSEQTQRVTTGEDRPVSIQRVIGQVFEYGLLLLVAHYSWVAEHLLVDVDRKIRRLSLAGALLDPLSLLSPNRLIALKVMIFALLALWVLKRARRWIYAAAPVVFILLMSSVVESHFFVRHQTNFCAMAFVVLGAVRFFGCRQGKTFDQVDPLPPWAFMTLVFYIGVSYTYSGLAKLHYSGLAWGDGRSLMMWIDVHATARDNILFHAITGSRFVAAALQTTTLVAETAAILMLFMPRLRPALGIVLVGFHASIEWLLGFGFYGNVFLDLHLLVVCFAVPSYRVMGIDFLQDLLASGARGVFATSNRAQAG